MLELNVVGFVQAQDLISVFITYAPGFDSTGWSFALSVGGSSHVRALHPDSASEQAFTVPFTSGMVAFQVLTKSGVALLQGQGKDITGHANTYNYNAWSGVWSSGE
jgi:hypothetical protein